MNLQIGNVVEFEYELSSSDFASGTDTYTIELRKGIITSLEPGYAPDVNVIMSDGKPYGIMKSDVLRVCTIDTIINMVKDSK